MTAGTSTAGTSAKPGPRASGAGRARRRGPRQREPRRRDSRAAAEPRAAGGLDSGSSTAGSAGASAGGSGAGDGASSVDAAGSDGAAGAEGAGAAGAGGGRSRSGLAGAGAGAGVAGAGAGAAGAGAPGPEQPEPERSRSGRSGRRRDGHCRCDLRHGHLGQRRQLSGRRARDDQEQNDARQDGDGAHLDAVAASQLGCSDRFMGPRSRYPRQAKVGDQVAEISPVFSQIAGFWGHFVRKSLRKTPRAAEVRKTTTASGRGPASRPTASTPGGCATPPDRRLHRARRRSPRCS